MGTSVVLVVLLAIASSALAGGPYGLAKEPFMGWRSWNCFHANVDQTKMMIVMDKISQRNRTVNGKPTSLADLGYVGVGLDDNWQACGKGVNGSFFGPDGTPLINTDRFPDMKKMNDYAHSKNLKSGWYGNNCICGVRNLVDPAFIESVYRQTVKMLVDFGYDGIKLDGCSQFHNTSLWSALMNETGRSVVVENCHNTHQPQTIDDWGGECPFNWFRSSTDINPSWHSIYSNLQTTTKYQGNPPLSRPSCWAYPDMLEVGQMSTWEEDRTHFGAWCVVSSPLILGYDITDESLTDKVWDIITNTKAIEVNQQWAGHPGMLVKTVTRKNVPFGPGNLTVAVPCNASDATQSGWAYDADKKTISVGGMCLDAKATQPTMTLQPCTGSADQQFVLDPSASSTATGLSFAAIKSVSTSQCLDVWAGAGLPGGPQVQMYNCHKANNELFSIADGTFMEKAGGCLAHRNIYPSPGGPTDYQLWAKPQPDNAWAAFVLSDLDAGLPNRTVTIDFRADLNMTATSVGVYDIWARKDLGTAQRTFTTDTFGGHDSRFYIFTPKA